jgi:hypothetical protein
MRRLLSSRAVRVAAFMLAMVAARSASAQGTGEARSAQSSDTLTLRSPQRLPEFRAPRAALEFTATYAAVASLYYFDKRVRHIDRSFADGLGMIFSPSRLRFDDNKFGLNAISHPVGGLAYYGIPRVNGASATHSFLFLLGASVFWEQVIELQEIASINDHIATPISGFAVGEAAFQDRMFFRRGAGTVLNEVLDRLFGLPLNVSEIVASRPAPAAASEIDAAGFADDVGRRFRFFVGAADLEGDAILGTGPRFDFGIETEVQAVGRRDAPGERAGWFAGVASTRLDIEVSRQEGRVVEWRAFAQAVPGGWYVHRVSDRAGSPAGYSLLVGPVTGFEVDQLGEDGNLFVQRIGAYTLGGIADAVAVQGAGRARLVVEASANLADIASTGRFDYPPDRQVGESTVFVNEGYYHGLGVTGAARLTIGRGPLEITAALRQHRIRSLDGRDRIPERATNVMPKRDRWTGVEMGAAWRPLSGIELAVFRRRRTFRGSIADHARSMRHSGWSVRLSGAF